MAFSLSSHIPLSPSYPRKPIHPSISTNTHHPILSLKPINNSSNRNSQFTIFKAIEDSKSSVSEESTTDFPAVQPEKDPPADELSELGAEIKKAMKEREESKDFWSGVNEEIGEIEWPAFNKVLSTTGVVLGVIAGSSVVLLTVNAVLAELSDQVFAGKGFQDFFG